MRSLIFRLQLGALFLVPLFSQPLTAQTIPYAFTRLTVADGLPGNQVLAIMQDRAGFIWIGTESGLAQYDGYDLRTFMNRKDDPSSVGSNVIQSLLEDSSGRIWIGTLDNGVNWLDRRTGIFTRVPSDSSGTTGPSDVDIMALHELADGSILIGTTRGLDRFSDGKFDRLTMPGVDPGRSEATVITDFEAASDGGVWISSDEGFFKYHVESQAVTRVSVSDDPAVQVNVALEANDGQLWLGTMTGLMSFSPGTGETKSYQYVTATTSSWSNRVFSIVEGSDGEIWVGSMGGDVDDGLHRLNSETGEFSRFRSDPDDPFSLSGNRVLRLMKDSNGLIWIGLRWGGLNMLDPTGSRFAFHGRSGLYDGPGSEIFALTNTGAGAVMAGMWDGGVASFNIFSDESVRWTNRPDSPVRLSGADGIALFVDEDASTWVGTFDGLDHIDARGNVVKRYKHDPQDPGSIAQSFVSSVTRDRDGSLWVGTWDGGISVLRDGRDGFVHYVHEPGDDTSLPSNDIRAFFFGPDGKMWIRMEGVLASYDPDSGDFHALDIARVTSAYVAKDGRIWVGTDGNGLVKAAPDGNIVREYGRAENLPHGTINGVRGDAFGRIWVTTARGISRLIERSNSFKTYTTTPLLRPNKVGTTPSISTPDGLLVFGGGNGILAFDPGRIEDDPSPPHIILTSAQAGDSTISAAIPGTPTGTSSSPVRLRHDQNDLAFRFIGLSFRQPMLTSYRFRLTPYETRWQFVGTERLATYTNLDRGSYTFEVQAANADGVWSEVSATFPFAVLPPWWKSTFAYFLYIIFALTAVFGGYSVRTRALRKRTAQLEKEVAERTKELQETAYRIGEAKEVIERQADQLLELDRLKSRFFANISHEFRTPLTLILGPVKDALSGTLGKFDTVMERQLIAMERNGRRLLLLINQLLDLSKLEAGASKLQARETQIVPLLRRLVLSFSSLAERRDVRLALESDLDEAVVLFVDEDRFEQIINNLLSNALKFTPNGGQVKVQLGSAGGGQPVFVCRITDSGPGISEKDQERIFERFRQGNHSNLYGLTGSGLGLALVKEWTLLHHGTVDVESKPNAGSTFILRVPFGRTHLRDDELADLDDEAGLDSESGGDGVADFHPFIVRDHETLAHEDRQAPANAPVVLVVEDNPDVRTYVRDLLSPRYVVREAANGKEGFELAESIRPALIISDVMMPDVDGYALCRQLKQHDTLGETPVILLTAKAEEEGKVEGLKTGADDYIYKPFNASELLVRVENLIEIRQFLRKTYSRRVMSVSPTEIEISSSDEQFLARVQEAVENHIDNPNFGTEWLADEIGLSTRQLRRKMKDCTNLTTSGYIRTLRLGRAAQLLDQGAGTVSEIAHAVGFQDPKHFSKLFRQVYGVAPSRFAKLPSD